MIEVYKLRQKNVIFRGRVGFFCLPSSMLERRESHLPLLKLFGSNLFGAWILFNSILALSKHF